MNLNNIRTGDLKAVFDALEEAFKAIDIDYYMIGAIAKDIWYSKGSSDMRRTKDVDFAALVGSQAEYESVRTYLVEEKNFSTTGANAFALVSPEKIQVDILPFGEIEIDDGVKVNGVVLSSIKVNGFKEVYTGGTERLEIGETGHHFEVATLPAIVLLKLIAFDDRPEKRYKDAADIANIIKNFFGLQVDLIYDKHHDLFGGEDNRKSLEMVSSVVIGREIKEIISGNSNLLGRIKGILMREIRDEDKSPFIRNMTNETGSSVSDMIEWLKGMLEGLDYYKEL